MKWGMDIKCMKTKIRKLFFWWWVGGGGAAYQRRGEKWTEMAAHGGRTACRTAGWSAVSTALLHDGRHALLVLPLVLLVELSGLTVGRTVGVRLIKQGLTRRRETLGNVHFIQVMKN